MNIQATPVAATATDGLYGAQRVWALLAILLGTFLGNLDAAIANIAMPVISRDLGSTAATTVWVVNAYQLVMAVTVLPLAVLGDRVGWRRLYITGLVIFTVGSLACTPPLRRLPRSDRGPRFPGARWGLHGGHGSSAAAIGVSFEYRGSGHRAVGLHGRDRHVDWT